MRYTVYALYSENFSKIYIGFTSNLPERLKSHNYLGKKGYTRKYRPWVLVYSEVFEVKSQAMKREKELKSARGREFVWSIIRD